MCFSPLPTDIEEALLNGWNFSEKAGTVGPLQADCSGFWQECFTIISG